MGKTLQVKAKTRRNPAQQFDSTKKIFENLKN